MRIRNRSLSFSAPLSRSFTPDLSTKHQREEDENEQHHQDEAEGGKVQLHRPYFSDHSFPPSKGNRSPSKEDDQLRQGCRNHIEGSSCMLPQEDIAIVEEIEEKEGEEKWSASDNRSAQTARPLLSSQVGARWCEGESAFPLKKRKRKYESMIVASEQKTKTKNKNKKEEEDDDEDGDDGRDRVIKVKKVNNNNIKSNVLEGSRCSRVNGRGWRCCQATLVGYSLCEHHLGKGRLKSINNSLRRSSTNTSSRRIGLTEHKKKLQEEEEKKKKKTKKKKENAVGIVKARSISSLLEQIEEGSSNMH